MSIHIALSVPPALGVRVGLSGCCRMCRPFQSPLWPSHSLDLLLSFSVSLLLAPTLIHCLKRRASFISKIALLVGSSRQSPNRSNNDKFSHNGVLRELQSHPHPSTGCLATGFHSVCRLWVFKATVLLGPVCKQSEVKRHRAHCSYLDAAVALK